VSVGEHPSGHESREHPDAVSERQRADRQRGLGQGIDLPVRGGGRHRVARHRREAAREEQPEVPALAQRRDVDGDLADPHPAPSVRRTLTAAISGRGFVSQGNCRAHERRNRARHDNLGFRDRRAAPTGLGE
jgi:hypothetical protein